MAILLPDCDCLIVIGKTMPVIIFFSQFMTYATAMFSTDGARPTKGGEFGGSVSTDPQQGLPGGVL